MSRAGAGLGALVGGVAGTFAGLVGGSYVSGFSPDELDDNVYYRKNADVHMLGMLGGIVGATIGGAVGAGSGEPEKATGVGGCLPTELGKGLFP